MQLAKLLNSQGLPAVGKIDGEHIAMLDLVSAGFGSLADLLAASNVAETASKLSATGERVAIKSARLLPPIDSQEVWAAGVPLIIHNIGAGTQQEDRLFAWPITGHYRFAAIR